jgi:hypothetical protein
MILPYMLICAKLTSVESLATSANAIGIYRRPIGNRMEFFARNLLGTPYVGATLDQEPEREQCTVILSGLDCVTFMETVFNMARTKDLNTESLKLAVTKTRYWNGKVDGYLSRLHYTSDWFYENDRRGIVTDISAKLPGAVPFTKKVGFMSMNSGKYPALVKNPDLLPALAEMEARSNSRKKWFVPIAALKLAETKLKTGDIIALCGGAEGIDCTHVGLIIVEQGVPHFVHASSKKKSVIFDAPLSEYLQGSKYTTGIMVARPVENLKGLK